MTCADTNMADTGYWADEEYEEQYSTCTGQSCKSDEDVIMGNANANHQFFGEIPRRAEKQHIPRFVDDHFFGDIPRRRTKRRLPHFVDVSSSSGENVPAKRSTSLYYSSRMLNQYFLDQAPMVIRQPVTPPILDQEPVEKVPVTVATVIQAVPLLTSSRHILVENAISFSPIPRYETNPCNLFNVQCQCQSVISHTVFLHRVVIEADIPHRVVHTNAAYARRYGSSRSSTSTFEAPYVENHQDLEVAVGSLFDSSTDALTMYPVWESEKEVDGEGAHVTHFLIEASNWAPLEPMDDTLYNIEKNPWREAPAHAIA